MLIAQTFCPALVSFTPASLFAGGEQGAWYDPTDLGSLWQLSGGTTAVTAINDPIGRMSDKSGNSNHATQTTAAARPQLNNFNTTLGEARSAYRPRYDFVDDQLRWGGPTGDYWIAANLLGGVRHYQARLTNAGNLPPLEHGGLVIRDTEFSAAEKLKLNAWFATKLASVADQAVFEVRGTSYVGRGGAVTSGTPTWLFGDGTSYTTMFSTTEATVNRERLSFNTTAPGALTRFNCSTNQLTGSIPSLSANTALTEFYCSTNQLTGSIPSLSANTALARFHCYTNQLTGSIPSLSANTALTEFYCHTNQLTGSIPSLSANTALTIFHCSASQLTDWSGGTVSATLGNFQAQNNLLTQAAVDAILAAFVAAGRASGTRTLNLGGTGNATPSAAGLTNKVTLQSRGWTVTTN